MQQPTWDQFSAFFAAKENKDAQARREFFLRQQVDWEGRSTEREDYQQSFLSEYGIHIDWKEGVFSLLDAISAQLGQTVFPVVFEDDSEDETATVDIAGSSHRFYHYQVGTDGFDNAWERIENLLAQNGYGLRFHVGDGISDTMSFLLAPESAWARAEQEYGVKDVAAHFVVYGSTYYVPELDAEMVAGNKRKPKAPAPEPYEVWMVRICLWCVLPVLAAFGIWVLWGVLVRH